MDVEFSRFITPVIFKRLLIIKRIVLFHCKKVRGTYHLRQAVTAKAAKEADRSPVRMCTDNGIMIEGINIHCIAPGCFDFVVFKRRNPVNQLRLFEGSEHRKLRKLNAFVITRRREKNRPFTTSCHNCQSTSGSPPLISGFWSLRGWYITT